MTDLWLTAVALVLIIAVPFDWYVAVRFTYAAVEKPYIPILVLAALRSVAIAIAATLAGILGAASLIYAATGQRILPTPWGAVMLAAALIVISAPNVYALRELSRVDDEPPAS